MALDKIPLEYLIETIAKALCFENYVAVHNIDDFESVNMANAVKYYEERSEVYLVKSYELLTLFHDFDSEEISDTVH
jgi:hypothetical protein